jgi:hypothetical protein
MFWSERDKINCLDISCVSESCFALQYSILWSRGSSLLRCVNQSDEKGVTNQAS